MEKVKR